MAHVPAAFRFSGERSRGPGGWAFRWEPKSQRCGQVRPQYCCQKIDGHAEVSGWLGLTSHWPAERFWGLLPAWAAGRGDAGLDFSP